MIPGVSWFWAKIVGAAMAVLAVGGFIFHIFLKGKRAGRESERRKNQEAYEEAEERKDVDRKDLESTSDDELDRELLDRRESNGDGRT